MSESESSFTDESRATGEVAEPPRPEPSETITPEPNPMFAWTPKLPDIPRTVPGIPWMVENMAFRDDPEFFEEWQWLLKQQREELFPPEADEE